MVRLAVNYNFLLKKFYRVNLNDITYLCMLHAMVLQWGWHKGYRLSQHRVVSSYKLWGQFLENVVSMQQSSKCQKPSISMVTYPISLKSLPGLANFFVLHNKFCNPPLSVEDNMEPVGTSFTIIHHSCVPSLWNDNVHNSYMLEASNFIMRTKCCRYVYELFYDSIFLDFAVFTCNKKPLLMFLGALFVYCLYFVIRFQLVLNEFLD